jgi:hypothetical protein
MTCLALHKLLVSGSEDLPSEDQRMISGKSGLAGKLLAAGRDIDVEMYAAPTLLF